MSREAKDGNEKEKKGEIKAAEEQREKVEKYMNADNVIVSKHKQLLKGITEEHESNAGSGEELGDKEYIGRTAEYGGLEIYIDEEGEFWAGDQNWVIPIKIDFKED